MSRAINWSGRMKPNKWDELTDRQKQKVAEQLFKSPRGFYIISQAMHYGIKKLNEIPDPYKELSNIQDMEIIRECIFNFPILDNDEQLKMIEKLKELKGSG
jgi:hypothetical protein